MSDAYSQYLDGIVEQLLEGELPEYHELVQAAGAGVKLASEADHTVEQYLVLALTVLVQGRAAIGDILLAAANLQREREGSSVSSTPDPNDPLAGLPLPPVTTTPSPDPTSQPSATAVPAPPKSRWRRGVQRPAGPPSDPSKRPGPR